MSDDFVYQGHDLSMVTCYGCGVYYAIPSILNRKALDKRPNVAIHCPNGHSWHYVGETDADKMRRERDLARQDAARIEEERLAAERRAVAAEGRERRLKKRAAAGTCPCCKRTFSNMATHMRKQHPAYVADNVVPLKAKA